MISDYRSLEFGLLSTRARVLVLVALVLVAFAFLGTRPLWSPDEGRYTAVALEMISSGDWLHPRLHPEVYHYTKPPVTYWAIAASVSVFGENEWAMRFPYGLALLATTYFVYRIGRHLVPGASLIAPVVYATSLLPFIGANVITTDTIAACATTYYAWMYLEARGARASAVMWMWAGAGVAFLIKGPPVLLPLVGLLAFAIREREARRYFRLLPLILFAMVAGSWYLAVIVQDPGLLRYFVQDEVIGRVASSSFHRNAGPLDGFSVYVPTVLVGFLPWWPLAVWRARTASWWPNRNWSAEARLLVWWIGIPLLVFMISRSRLPLYLLPLAAPLSLAIARGLNRAPLKRASIVAVCVWSACLIASRPLIARLDRQEDDRALASAVSSVVKEPLAEVVFVDTAPRYGLRHYLSAGIERLGSEPGDPTPASEGDFIEELLEAETAQCYLVETKAEARFQHTLGAMPRISAERLGVAREYTIYRLTYRPISGQATGDKSKSATGDLAGIVPASTTAH